VGIYIVSTLLIVLAIDLVLVQLGLRIPHGYATTRITEPLLEDGSIDYLTAIENHFGAGVTPQNNAAPLLLEAFGRAALPSNPPRDGITARLGMPPLPETGDYFQKRANDLEDLEPLMQQPWQASAHPRVAAWIAANEKPLAKIAEAAKRQRYFMPFNGGNRPELLTDLMLPQLWLIGESSRALTCRSMLKATAGDFAGARSDLMIVHDMARLIGQGATLIDRLVAYAVDNLASTAEASIAAEGKLQPLEAARWRDALRSLPPLADFADAVDVGERYLVLDMMQYASKHGMYRAAGRIKEIMEHSGPAFGVKQTLGTAGRFAALMPVRLAPLMEESNACYDRFAATLRKPPGVERHDAAAAVVNEFNASPDRSRELWPEVLRWGLSAILKSLDRADATVARRELAATAMGLAAKDQPGTELPIDPFSGSPLVYRPTADGYLLYSVGPNRINEHGNGDDLALRSGDAAATKPATAP
jgi:hypothetical protein